MVMAEPVRWLDDHEQDLWRSILQANRKINRVLDETLLNASGLSTAEYGVLVVLSEAPNHCLRLCALCDELVWDRSRTSHQITRMEKRGLLRKERFSGDGRGVSVVLTDDGMQRLQKAVPDHVESVRRLIFDHLDEDDKPSFQRFMNAVLAVDNIPGYEAADGCPPSASSAPGPDN